MANKDTSWGKVAEWYDELLTQNEGTYQKEVVLPHLIRILNPEPHEKILDLACGQGFFTAQIATSGAQVIGADISKELIELAKKHIARDNVTWHVSPAHSIPFVSAHSIDSIIIILALQNIENISDVFKECARVLRPHGRLIFVLNHPSFRIPKASSWQFDEINKVQYRRIDQYMSEKRDKIEMNPGATGAKHYTISFHRPLQVYMKALHKNKFAVCRLEEWISHKKSVAGPRMAAENNTRKEIPLFMMIEAIVVPEDK